MPLEFDGTWYIKIFSPPYCLFRLIRKAFEMWHWWHTKLMALVALRNFTLRLLRKFILVNTALPVLILSMVIEFFRYDGWRGYLIIANSIVFFYPFDLISIVMLQYKTN